MRPKDIAQALRETATLMQIVDENPFKVRAFENAARSIETLEQAVSELIVAGNLASVPGIGAAIAEQIVALVHDGQMPERERLLSVVPPGLLAVLKVPGLGGKKVQRLWRELGVTDLDGLTAACNAHRVSELSGFGKKTEAKIIEGIERLRSFSGRFLRASLEPLAQRVRDGLARASGVSAVAIAGSLRRKMAVSKDIDLVVGAEDHQAVVDALRALPEVLQIDSAGPTKIMASCVDGVVVDLRVVDPANYFSALVHYTGSKEHNIELRRRAKERGLKLNEYGLHRENESLDCPSEAALYQLLGLPEIPPELREDLGEFDAAEAGALPQLITHAQLQGVVHMHTRYSDGADSVEAMARRAQQLGYHYIGISDHSQFASYAGGLDESAIRRQHDEIDRVQQLFPDLHILKGIEADILQDGSLDYDESIWPRFDFIVASVHNRFRMDGPAMTARILRALENPYVTILGHPTGRLLLKRDPYDLDLQCVIARCAELGVAIEINGNPRRLDLDWRLCRQAVQAGATLAINPDAHSCGELENMRFGVEVARKGWVEATSVLNARDLEGFLAFAQARRR